jgi:sulfate adenylyltransferase large subunit
MTLPLKGEGLRVNLAADTLQRSLQPVSPPHTVPISSVVGERLSRDSYDGVPAPRRGAGQVEWGTQVPATAAQRSLLRFITCGSVDDGKSTLIGRLLFDSHVLLDDQLETLRKDSKKSAHTGGEIDYSLLLDGLAAEREQGITIDVAYRYFSTPARAFIVADTPGHVQYTRNMATGASTADLAIILVDARKGVLEQTRRHCTIVAMLGVRHIVLAINKMDLVGYSEEKFRDIDQDFRMSALDNSFASLTSIPMSAKLGDNLREPSAAMPWYKGPSLLEVLETVEPEANSSHLSARFPVQWVNRGADDFRGFSGTLASGTLRPGDAIRVLPSGHTANIARIVTFTGDLPQAVEGQAPTLVLDREIDISRGDVIVADDGTAKTGRRWNADLLWMSNTPFEAGRSLLLKIGARTVPVRLDAAMSVLDIATGARHTRAALGPNDIAGLTVETDAAIVAERYNDSRMLGGFILIDRLTSETVAMGLIKDQAPEPVNAAQPDASHAAVPIMAKYITKPAETAWRSLAKAVSWRATGSVDTFILAYIFTGHVKVAAAISGTEIITKIVLYFVHERIWQRFAPGRVDVKRKD